MEPDKITLAVIATVAGIILKPAAEYLVALLQFNFIGFRVRKLDGKWKSSWSFSDKDKNQSHSDLIDLSQVGPYIRGKAKGEKHSYIIKGRLNPDGHIYGSWRDIQGHTDWYGSFQLKVHPEGKRWLENGWEILV